MWTVILFLLLFIWVLLSNYHGDRKGRGEEGVDLKNSELISMDDKPSLV